MRPGLLVLLTLAGGAGPAAAQLPWRASYYPYVLKGPNDQVTLVAHWHYAQNADYDDRVPFAGIVSAEAGLNGSGSRFATARFKWPRMAAGWRLFAEAGVSRENRFGYAGMGNGAELVPDLPPGSRYYNRMSRGRAHGRVDLTRELATAFRIGATLGFSDAVFAKLPGDSRFEDDFFLVVPCLPGEPCPAPRGDPGDTDVTVQLMLVADTRDNEFVPRRGVFVEAGALTGSGGEGYTGVYATASGYAPMGEGTVLAARVLARRIGEDAPLDARYTLTAWERSIPLLGGPESHRSYIYGRWAGREVLLGNVELRVDILNFGDYGAITALGFLDAGRVKEGLPGEPDPFRVGGGAGLALRILRSTVLQVNFAGGGDGFRFSMGSGWAF
jgi:outer membrane protein assembly factor BamA